MNLMSKRKKVLKQSQTKNPIKDLSSTLSMKSLKVKLTVQKLEQIKFLLHTSCYSVTYLSKRRAILQLQLHLVTCQQQLKTRMSKAPSLQVLKWPAMNWIPELLKLPPAQSTEGRTPSKVQLPMMNLSNLLPKRN